MSSGVPLALPHLDLKPSFGALYIGVLTAIGLLGITTLQTWLYYSRYPMDSWVLRALVAVIWCLELLHSTFGAHALYHYLILNWGNPEALASSIWSLDITLLVTAIVEVLIRIFFMWCVWIVSDYKWYIPAIIGFFGLCAFSFNIATYALSVTDEEFAHFGLTIHVISSTGLTSSIFADVTTSASLAYFLNSKRTGFSKTNRLINRLIFFAVNIGMLTSLTDIAVVACSALKNTNLAYLSIYEVVSKLYANSLLATLNIRDADSKNPGGDSEFRMSEIRSRLSRNVSAGASDTRIAGDGVITGEAPSTSGSVLDGAGPGDIKVFGYNPPNVSLTDQSLGAV